MHHTEADLEYQVLLLSVNMSHFPMTDLAQICEIISTEKWQVTHGYSFPLFVDQ